MIEKITAKQAKEIMDHDQTIQVVDVREQDEFDGGHIQDAILIPLSDFIVQTNQQLKDKKQKLLLYCGSGKRCEMAANLLDDMGYENIHCFGSLNNWPYEIVK